jgi:hypothetical protein
MAHVKLTCPHCRARLRGSSAHLADRISCPACKQTFCPALPAPPPIVTRRWGPVLALASVGVALVLGLTIGLVVWLIPPRQPPADPVLKIDGGRGAGNDQAPDGPAGNGKRHALLIGVRDYKHLPHLRFTENDVTELAGLLRPAGYEVTLLTGAAGTDGQPTGANIRAHLDKLVQKCGKSDTLLLAFAGHGLQEDEKRDCYFCPPEGDPDRPDTLVSLTRVYARLNASRAGAKLLLVDACRNQARGATRGIDGHTAPRPPRGVAALFSCSPGQQAFETEKLGKGHGVFFHFVLEGLRGKARNDEDAVTWDSLGDYVKRQVSRQVPKIMGGGARQTPHGLADLMGESPVLVRLSKPDVKPADKDKARPPDKDDSGKGKDGKGKDDQPGAAVVRPPSKERAVVASYVGRYEDLPGVLIRRKAGATGADGWEKVKPGEKIQSTDTLMSLPGFANLIRTDSGVSLLMRGNVREFALVAVQQYLAESAVVLHKNKEFDLDLTLLRGRIFLTNSKETGAARIRLRFSEREVWDIALASKGDQVGVDYLTVYTPDINHRIGEDPRGSLFLVLIRGEATIKVNDVDQHIRKATPPGAYLFAWDSFRQASEPREMKQLPASWNKKPPTIKDVTAEKLAVIKRMSAVLKDLEVLLSAGKKVNIAIKEGQVKEESMARLLSIYCQGAIDDPGPLVDAMGDEELAHVADRQAAIFTLQHWLARGPAQGKLLYDRKADTGVLRDKQYTKNEAQRIGDLLFALPHEDWTRPETFEVLASCVSSPRVAIAELGYSHLLGLARGVKLPPFNAADPVEERKKFARKIEDMVARKQLPPPPERKEGAPGTKSPATSAVPPAPEIESGQALNQLLAAITRLGALNRGPNIKLDEDILKHLNVRDRSSSGNIGLLKGDGELKWPLAFHEKQFDAARKQLTLKLKDAVSQLKKRKKVAATTLKDADALRKTLEDKLDASAGDRPMSQSTEAKRYLAHVRQAILALKSPNAANYFSGTWTARGKTVGELVYHIRKEGLEFAPATSGDEAAYFALYQKLREFTDGLPPKEK